jgi:hypothetical protein
MRVLYILLGTEDVSVFDILLFDILCLLLKSLAMVYFTYMFMGGI